MKTQLHHYNYDLDAEQDRLDYGELCRELISKGYKLMDCIDMNGMDKTVSGEIYLDTKYLFDNQWNTSSDSPTNPDCRVFDWRETIDVNNRKRKVGHWLEITEEMQSIRDNTHKCGYCGNMEPAAKGYTFCPACIGSEFLEVENLHLTRMLAISDKSARKPLTEAERENILPGFIEAQTRTTDARKKEKARKQYEKVKSDCDKAIANALAKRDGFLWLLEHNVNIDNCIYYETSGLFAFGWRHPIDNEVQSALLDILVEFPFEYEINAKEEAA